MKKIFTLITAVLFVSGTFALSVPGVIKNDPLASEIFITVSKDGKKISLKELATISKKDLESLTGRKMNGVQTFAFKGAQKKLAKGIDSNGYLTNKKMKRMFANGESSFNGGGLALGLLLGLIGVLIAYLINDEKKSDRRKWAWIGFGISVVIGLIIIAAAM